MGTPANWYFSSALPPTVDWQDRVQFHQLLNWWKNSQGGVCALTGPGGAGKSTIVTQFLATLSQRTKENAEVVHPERLFSYSFYEDTSLRQFFCEFDEWITGRRPSPDAATEQLDWQSLFRLPGRSLIVIDGLEEMGDRFGFEGTLHDFLLKVARRTVPNVSVVMTTRNSVVDEFPRLAHAPGLLVINVGPLTMEEGVAFLRRRRIAGTKAELGTLVRQVGGHALALTVAAGYVSHYLDGKPQRFAELFAHSPDINSDLVSLEAAFRRSEETGNLPNQAKLLGEIGAVYLRSGILPVAREKFEHAVELSRKHGFHHVLLETLTGLADIQMTQGCFDASRSHLQEALEISRRYGEPEAQVTILNNLSAVARGMNLLDEALALLQESLAISHRLASRPATARVLNNLATIYHQLGRFEQARGALEEAMMISHETGDLWSLATSYNNLSSFYKAAGHTDQAKKTLRQALEIRIRLADFAGAGRTLLNLGLLHLHNQEGDAALQSFFQAYLYAQRADDSELLREINDVAANMLPDRKLSWPQVAQRLGRVETPAEN